VVRHTLKLAEGATYILRAEGADRFENVITGQNAVQISDDDDTVRLRILADKHLYKAGDTAKVQIHWREEPALALVTYQGAKVLDYKLVELNQGMNILEVPMAARLAPNFELSVIVMTDTRAEKKADRKPAGVSAAAGAYPGAAQEKPVVRFHTAASQFRVTRDLKVTLETKRKTGAKGPIRPGEELELVVKATDPQGKPVVAELSVAMVEQSLLAMFGSHVPAIHDFFAGGMREITVRSGSSITFSYRPATRAIDKQLLAEAERLEIAAEESARLATTDPFGVAAGAPLVPADQPTGAMAFDADGSRIVTAGEAPQADDSFRFWAGQSRDGQSQELALAGDIVINEADPLFRGYAASLNGLAVPADERAGINNRMLLGAEIAKQQKLSGSNRRSESVFRKDMGAQQQAQQGDSKSGDTRAGRRAGSQADFDSLLSIVSPTIAPTAWQDAGADAQEQLGKEVALGLNGRRANDAEVTRQVLELNTLNITNSVQWGFKDFTCATASGEQFNVNFRNSFGDTLDVAEVRKFAENLARSGAVIVAQRGPQETGYWSPMVVTDEKGEATLTITMPEQSSAWRINAKGITADTLAGEADIEIVAKKDLFGELKLPLAFTDGDDAEIIVSVHHDLKKDQKSPIRATLRTIIGGRTLEEQKNIEVTGGGLQELTFKTSIRRPEKTDNGDSKTGNKEPKETKDAKKTGNAALDADAPQDLVAFELVVESGDQQDRIRRVVPIRPFGVPVYVTASGSASSDTTAWIEPNPDMPLGSPGLQIIIGPTVERSLLDIVLGAPSASQVYFATIASGLDVTTSDLMASLALQKLLGETRDKLAPQAQALDARIRTAVSQLVSSQQDDGGWTWSGHGNTSHRFTSARVVWALALAKRAGYKFADDRFEKAKTYLQSQIANTSETDFESKAILLHALSVAGQGDFTLANRLHRNKPSLSTAALAHLALAFAEMDRKQTAAELLGDLGERNLTTIPARRTTALGSLPWSHSPAELRALFALGLQMAAPQSPKTKEQIDWLMAHRSGHRWSPEKATGPAAMAVATWYAKTRFEDQHYKLTVFVNDLQAAVLDITDETETLSVDVPARMLKEGKQRINFQLTGRGRYTYQAVLGGFVAADKLKNTTKNWTVRRFHGPAPLELDGQEIPRGFDVLQGSYSTFRNPLTQLPVGKRGHVELLIFRTNLPPNTPEEQLEYLVVTEPLPSGVTVVESSITGGFERFEVGAGEITFYLGNRQHVGTISFDVHGYLPGTYKAPPSIIRNAYRPDQLAVSELKNLEVLALGAKSKDEYRLTPRELYELGKRHFAKNEFKTAGTHLAELLAKWNVNPDTYKDTARMLLDVHLSTGPAGEIVRYFEIIKEKWPDLEIPYEKIMKVAAAYHDIGEYERSYLVYRATVESSFINENGVAGFLESQGEFLRSVDVMNRLLAEYPPEPYVAATMYALAQRVYAKAPQAAADPKLREKKVNRVVLIQQALAMLDHFLTLYPEDPAADQAAFSLANALLELKVHKEVVERASRYAERYKTSEFLDSFWYIQAYGHFALGEHEKALEMAKKVAEHKRTERQTGREIESPNKWQAIYIMGQVFHSLGKAAEAIAEYTKVNERFQDAKEAIAYFTRKAISLPEVTTVRPNEPGEVELKFRNVAAAEIRVYRIDLMKFSLLKRNLLGITEINLSGIRPFFEETFKLGDGKDYRDRTEKLKLPLKEEGAYLVVCRGDDLHASGLVLVSPLTVEVQEDAPAGRVRVTVKNVLDEDYVADAHAKVIGSRNNEFVSGQADLRGVFVAEGIQGKSTVIAQVEDDRYAFFRGQTELGPQPAPNAPATAGAAPAAYPPGESKALSNERILLEQLQGGNREIQQRQNDLLDKNYKMPSNSGVKAQSAF
jgi:tetratricopeptide (TPR) repeat protein